jgi:hypothetical protein
MSLVKVGDLPHVAFGGCFDAKPNIFLHVDPHHKICVLIDMDKALLVGIKEEKRDTPSSKVRRFEKCEEGHNNIDNMANTLKTIHRCRLLGRVL